MYFMHVCFNTNCVTFTELLALHMICLHLRQLAPGELRRPVALHHDTLVLDGRLHHHEVIQQLVLVGGVQTSLTDLLVEARRG